MKNYDVFISCKSEDYPLAEKVYHFLTDNHIHTFLASKELRKLGDSEYREAIESAIECAEHLIVIASTPAHIISKWVKYEWGLFLNAKIDGDKKGNIITILNGIFPKDIAFALRRYESFQYPSFKESLLNYVETECSRQRAKEAKEKEIREAELRKKEEEKLRKIEEAKVQLVELAENFKKESIVVQAKIKTLLRYIGITEYNCPVCDTKNSIDEAFCATCGWIFSPVEFVKDAEYLAADVQKSITIYRHIFSAASALESDNRRLKGDLEMAKKYNREFHDTTRSLRSRIYELGLTDEANRQMIDSLNSNLSERDAHIEDLKKQIATLRGQTNHQSRSTNNSSTPRRYTSIPEMKRDRTTEHSYGILIKHFGINRTKVLELLAKEYRKPVELFVENLRILPARTAAIFNKKTANTIYNIIISLGATAEVYQG